MKHFWIVSLIAACWLCPWQAFSATGRNSAIHFTRISIESGLSQSTIFSITQDRDGNIWFATYDGVNKYDGYGFTVYQHVIGDETSIADDISRTLCTDRTGRIWVGTASGLSLYDGGQFELDPHYHLATIEIFIKALQAADLNGFRSDFPQSYIDTVEKMIEFYANICFPDYTNPLFSDAKLTKKGTMIGNYRKWAKIFPDNMFIKYLATEGKDGALPDYLSKGFLNSGFFVFRNGWGMDALQMVVKAGPKGEWHCQPDNGTFEMWYNGRSLFQDSGSYVYAGDAEVMEWRNWFRATAHHNTLTLNDKDLETTESRTLLWQPEGDVQILVTENQSYQDLKHRRSVFFVDGKYFVIVDEAVGSVSGNNNVNLHYQMPRGDVPNSREDMTFYTNFEDGSNFMFRCFGPENMTMKKDKGWISTAYNKKVQRMDVSFNVKKYDSPAVRFITVIYPKEKAGKEPALEARFLDKGFSEDGLKIQVRIGKEKKRVLGYEL